MDVVVVTRLGRRTTRRHKTSDDAGITLIELVVSMAIMGIFLTLFTGAMISIYRSTAKVQGITDTSAQISIAVSRLSSEARYASAIILSPPTGSSTVIFQSTYTGDTRCAEFQLDTSKKQLLRKIWVADVDDPDDVAWVPVATQVGPVVESGIEQPPFEVHDASNKIDGLGSVQSSTNPQIRIRLSSTSGAGTNASTSTTDVVFTAFNAAEFDQADALKDSKCRGVTP